MQIASRLGKALEETGLRKYAYFRNVALKTETKRPHSGLPLSQISNLKIWDEINEKTGLRYELTPFVHDTRFDHNNNNQWLNLGRKSGPSGNQRSQLFNHRVLLFKSERSIGHYTILNSLYLADCL